MFNSVKFAAIASAAALALVGPASAAQIFFDSFETPDVADWAVFQVAGDNGDWDNVLGAGIEIQDQSLGITNAYHGSQYVELDSDNSRGGVAGPTNSAMAAAIPFVAGKTYEISFAYKPRTNTAGDNVISLYALNYDGMNVNDDNMLFTISETTSTLSDWLLVTVLYTAETGFNAIGFLAGGIENSLGGFIDAVSVSVSDVPLPAALPLFLAGMAGFGFAGRGKRKAA